MNSKGHFYISLAKSVIRIVSSSWSLWTGDITSLAGGFLIAEVLGVFEELFDER